MPAIHIRITGRYSPRVYDFCPAIILFGLPLRLPHLGTRPAWTLPVGLDLQPVGTLESI